MDDEIIVMPLMDCEPAKTAVSDHANQQSSSGPEIWAESEQSIRSYVDIVTDHGLIPTLFIHPKTAEQHQKLFLELDDQGACLGLHLHPYKMSDEYKHDVGAYPEAEQREIISKATERWESAIGRHPAYFRPGMLSANDSTFGILDDLGFKGGSVSKPGKVWRSYAVAWTSAEPYPHRAHRGFRLLAGESDFIEVPHLGDINCPEHSNEHEVDQRYQSVSFSPHESSDVNQRSKSPCDLEEVTRNLIERFVNDDPRLPVLILSTHNNIDFTDSSNIGSKDFSKVVNTINRCADEMGFSARAETIDSVINEFYTHE